jgi:hypothetical protein
VMFGRLNGRVKRLENGRVKPCEECGFGGDRSDVEIVVEWTDLDGEGEYTGPEKTTYCETCGEPAETVVTWEDLPPEDGDTNQRD